MNDFTFHIPVWIACIAFKVYASICIGFPGNQTHDNGVASTMLKCLSFRKHLGHFHLATALVLLLLWLCGYSMKYLI